MHSLFERCEVIKLQFTSLSGCLMDVYTAAGLMLALFEFRQTLATHRPARVVARGGQKFSLQNANAMNSTQK